MTSRRRILQENIKLHKSEAYFYEANHPEIFNVLEQSRLKTQIAILKNEASGGLCVDVGSGTGNLGRLLRSAGFSVVACDLSREMLEQNDAEFRVRCEASTLPIRTQCASLVTGYSLFHHLPDVENALKEACRVAKEKALMYFDHDNFTHGVQKKATRVVKIRGVRAATLGLIWQIAHPHYLFRFAQYVFGGRRKHLIYLRNVDWNLTDGNIFQFQQFKKILQKNGFTGSLSVYSEGSYIKVQRRARACEAALTAH
jgi:ubiquinone/menaquinone biosynthesis C-methylase UbiE